MNSQEGPDGGSCGIPSVESLSRSTSGQPSAKHMVLRGPKRSSFPEEMRRTSDRRADPRARRIRVEACSGVEWSAAAIE